MAVFRAIGCFFLTFFWFRVYMDKTKGGRHMELKLSEKYMLTIKEAASYYGIGTKFMRRLAENKEGRLAVYCGNRWLIVRHLFDEYIEECCKMGKPIGGFVLGDDNAD